MKDLLTAIKIATEHYAFDRQMASETILEHIELENALLENVTSTNTEVFKRKVALSHLKMLYFALQRV